MQDVMCSKLWPDLSSGGDMWPVVPACILQGIQKCVLYAHREL